MKVLVNMNILLIGPQGSGKGTQAEKLVEKSGLFYIEMGGILREAAKTNPTIDRLINIEGKLVPDNVALSLVIEKIEKENLIKDNILFDGFPRSIAQFDMLSAWLLEYGKKINIAILIDIPDEESVKRLSARRKCGKCGKIWNLVTQPKPPSENKCDCGGDLTQRKDDTPEAIKERLGAYHLTTDKLVSLLEQKGILLKINGTKPIDDVTKDIVDGLNKWK